MWLTQQPPSAPCPLMHQPLHQPRRCVADSADDEQRPEPCYLLQVQSLQQAATTGWANECVPSWCSPIAAYPELSVLPHQCVQAAVPPVEVPVLALLASPPGTAVSGHRATPLPPLVLPKPELSRAFGGLAPAPAPFMGPAPAPGPSLNLLGAIVGPGVAVETAPAPQQKIIPSRLPFIAGPPGPATAAAPVLAPFGTTAVPPVAVGLVAPVEAPAALPALSALTLAPPEAAPPGELRESNLEAAAACQHVHHPAAHALRLLPCRCMPWQHDGWSPCTRMALLCGASHPTCGACRDAF